MSRADWPGCGVVLAEPRGFNRLILIVIGFALWVAATNFYLAFIRPWLFRRRHGSLLNYRFVSGLPMIGTVVVVLVLIANFGSHLLAVLALVVLLIDTGGLPWLVISIWRDRAGRTRECETHQP